jgi:hypothetical protein
MHINPQEYADDFYQECVNHFSRREWHTTNGDGNDNRSNFSRR